MKSGKLRFNFMFLLERIHYVRQSDFSSDFRFSSRLASRLEQLSFKLPRGSSSSNFL